jgi:hypothetical protein
MEQHIHAQAGLFRLHEALMSSRRGAAWFGILVATATTWAAPAYAYDQYENCVSDWESAYDNHGSLTDFQRTNGATFIRSVSCTVAGRTGHAALRIYEWDGEKDLRRGVEVWVCDADGSNCGVENGSDVACFAQTDTDSGTGTALSKLKYGTDERLGYETRDHSWGWPVYDLPMDENGVRTPVPVSFMRVVCLFVP